MSDTELLQQSDTVIIGEMVGRTEVELAPSAVKFSLAVVRVDEVLKGDRQAQVVLLEQPAGELRSSSDIIFRKGQKGVWFLQLRSKGERGIYRADHPQRFQTIDQAASLIKVLRGARP